ncbi:hypothetical protein GALMADRAFT_71333 [Galerina marginata CBS 339.88]|uniref:Uncharacterized protein n=1 Tax=Galerina marginata (strain CBS 339.88) TaxID=685588 RepID=A0A067ST21_GALM3|nr:hypothetical protein GALMADRAFT_71333 [Galerina marginata CBS 339.88]
MTQIFTHEDWIRSDKYHNSYLIPQDDILDAVVENSTKQGLPPIAVSTAQGKLLNLLAKTIGAKRVLEVGTLGGYSAILFARALPDDGQVVTLELSPENAKIAEENIKTAGQAHKVTIIVGPGADSIVKLHPEPPFDIAFIDADKENNLLYFTEAKRLVRSGGIIIVDNVVWEGAPADPEHVESSTEGIRRLLEGIKNDKDVEATTIATVGEKGYDGFLYALRK